MPRITTLTAHDAARNVLLQVRSEKSFFDLAMAEVSALAQAEMDFLTDEQLKQYSVTVEMVYIRTEE